MRRLRLIKVSSSSSYKKHPFRGRRELLYFVYKSINILNLSLIGQDRSATQRHSMY